MISFKVSDRLGKPLTVRSAYPVPSTTAPLAARRGQSTWTAPRAGGNLTDFHLLLGQAHDLRDTAALIEGLTCGQFLADQAFDTNWVREALAAAGIEAVIPPKSNRRFPAEFDRETYKWRNLIENFFGKPRNTGVSPCAAARPTQASPLSSQSQPPSD